jgi:hypothetical protein
MIDTNQLLGGGEDRVVECPVCSNVMTRMEASGVTLDVCAGGTGVTDRWPLAA